MRSASGGPRLWECRVPNLFGEGQDSVKEVFAPTRGRAKSLCLLYLLDAGWEVRFQDIRVRTIAVLPMSMLADFARTAEYRGVPFARIGMKVEVGGNPGRIVGKNSSANFQVHFTDGPHNGLELNCHPNWMFRYFGSDGSLIQEFKA